MKSHLKIVIGVFLLVIISGLQISKLQAKKYTRIDKHAVNVPDSVEENLILLHEYLIIKSKNDKERIRSFFSWMIHNIKRGARNEINFDPELMFFLEFNNCITVNCVLKEKETICEGYANLFKALCNLSNIKCEIIPGYLRYPYAQYTRATHAWNAVFIEGKWQLLDITWATAVGEKEKEIFFLPKPEEFVLNHLPLIPMWQLLPKPIPIDIFNQNADAISKYLSSSSQIYYYNDSINAFISTTRPERFVVMAQKLLRFNSNNHQDAGKYYYYYANYLYRENLKKSELSEEQLKRNLHQFEKALSYLDNVDSLTAFFMKREINGKIKKIKKKLK